MSRPIGEHGRYTKTTLCKFFIKKTCSRLVDCCFAHSEEEQRQACQAVMCRSHRGSVSTCRLGSQCWYAHRYGPMEKPREEFASVDKQIEKIYDGVHCTEQPIECISSEMTSPEASPAGELGATELSCSGVDVENTGKEHQLAATTLTLRNAGQTDKTLLCKFWLKGRCLRVHDCKFAHGEEEQWRACQRVMCRFIRTGTSSCTHGSNCWFAHSESELQSNLGVSKGDWSIGLDQDTNVDASVAECDDPIRDGIGSAQPAAAPCIELEAVDSPRLSATLAVSREDPVDNEAVALERAADSVAANSNKPATNAYYPQLGRSDKTLICKFWQKNRCSRKDNCVFAHGEEEQRQACKSVICRFYLESKSCRQGTSCWYAHSESEAQLHSRGLPASREIGMTVAVGQAASPDAICSEDVKDLECTVAAGISLSPGDFLEPPPRAEPQVSNKMRLCKYWRKGNCRLVSCEFAHGEEEQRRAYKAILCPSSTSCCLGSRCWYAHPEAESLADTAVSLRQQDTDSNEDANENASTKCSSDNLGSRTALKQLPLTHVAMRATKIRCIFSGSTAPGMTRCKGRSWADILSDDEDDDAESSDGSTAAGGNSSCFSDKVGSVSSVGSPHLRPSVAHTECV